MLRPKEPTRAYGDHTTMEARTTWVWRDSLDGELTLRPAQRVSSQIGILVRLFLIRSEEKSFRSIARLDGRRWLPPRRACALDTWGCNPGTKNTTHQERSANPGEAPGKLTFGLVPRLWRFFNLPQHNKRVYTFCIVLSSTSRNLAHICVKNQR